MIVHTRTKYSILLIIIFSICFSSPTIFAEDAVIEEYKTEIKNNPDDADAHFNLGLLYNLSNDKDSALEQCEILKSLDSELADKLFNLIYKQFRKKHLPQTTSHLIKTCIKFPE